MECILGGQGGNDARRGFTRCKTVHIVGRKKRNNHRKISRYVRQRMVMSSGVLYIEGLHEGETMSKGTATFTFRLPRESIGLIDAYVAKWNRKKNVKSMVRADFVRKAIASMLNDIARKETKGKKSIVPCCNCGKLVPFKSVNRELENLFGVTEYTCLKCLKEMSRGSKISENGSA